MRAVGWWGGNKSDPVYGLRITKADRDRAFDPSWASVAVHLDGQPDPVVVDLTPAFWRECHELRHPAIGAWFNELGVAPWPAGSPPSFALRETEPAQFHARPIEHKSLL